MTDCTWEKKTCVSFYCAGNFNTCSSITGVSFTEIRYTNIEGEAISWIYEAERNDFKGLIMNPAGFLFAGYALRECLKSVSLPYIEVHMTNIDRRGMHSITACEAKGMITGMGVESYLLALSAMGQILEKKKSI